MAADKIHPPVFVNPFLNITETPDSSVVRHPEPPTIPANSDPQDPTSAVLSKDVILDPHKKTWLRVYIPKQAIHSSSPAKLPVVLYFHGGGYVFFHVDTIVCDLFCKGLSEKAGVVVVSLEYRLAPENRLPAPYEDAVDALYWIRAQQDRWVAEHADVSNCFLFGLSSGGNLAYHAGLRAAVATEKLLPLKIRGLIIQQPYFSGSKRTESEQRLEDDWFLPLRAIHKMFDLCLPEGADYDHEYCNPFVNGGSDLIDRVRDLGWRVMVTGCYADPLVDAASKFAEMLEGKGLRTVRFFGDGHHAVELFDPSKAEALFTATKDFIFSD